MGDPWWCKIFQTQGGTLGRQKTVKPKRRPLNDDVKSSKPKGGPLWDKKLETQGGTLGVEKSSKPKGEGTLGDETSSKARGDSCVRKTCDVKSFKPKGDPWVTKTNRKNTLSMSSIMCLTTMDYLTDIMCTHMVSLKKEIISGHSSIHGHRSNKGTNNNVINLTYYCVLSVLSERKKSLCIRLSVYQEVMFRWIQVSYKLHRNVCEQSLKPKCHLLVHRSTLQNKIYYCVLLTMLHVIGHYWYKISVTYYYITTSVHKTGYRLQSETSRIFWFIQRICAKLLDKIKVL